MYINKHIAEIATTPIPELLSHEEAETQAEIIRSVRDTLASFEVRTWVLDWAGSYLYMGVRMRACGRIGALRAGIGALRAGIASVHGRQDEGLRAGIRAL